MSKDKPCILKKRLNGVFDQNIGLIIQRFPNLEGSCVQTYTGRMEAGNTNRAGTAAALTANGVYVTTLGEKAHTAGETILAELL